MSQVRAALSRIRRRTRSNLSPQRGAKLLSIARRVFVGVGLFMVGTLISRLVDDNWASILADIRVLASDRVFTFLAIPLAASLVVSELVQRYSEHTHQGPDDAVSMHRWPRLVVSSATILTIVLLPVSGMRVWSVLAAETRQATLEALLDASEAEGTAAINGNKGLVEFVSVRRATTADGWSRFSEAGSGERLIFRIDLKNTAPDTVAGEVHVEVGVDGAQGKEEVQVLAWATNAASVSDSVRVDLREPAFHLVYVPGSTRLWDDRNEGNILADGIVSNGVMIGSLPHSKDRTTIEFQMWARGVNEDLSDYQELMTELAVANATAARQEYAPVCYAEPGDTVNLSLWYVNASAEHNDQNNNVNDAFAKYVLPTEPSSALAVQTYAWGERSTLRHDVAVIFTSEPCTLEFIQDSGWWRHNPDAIDDPNVITTPVSLEALLSGLPLGDPRPYWEDQATVGMQVQVVPIRE